MRYYVFYDGDSISGFLATTTAATHGNFKEISEDEYAALTGGKVVANDLELSEVIERKIASETSDLYTGVSAFSRFALRSNVVLADGDADKNRVLASEFSPILSLDLDSVLYWSEGMTTQPGDLVMDPEQNYTYIYSGKDAMTHSNPLFYPGATGVYYWAIIPKVKDGFKIYPDISGIIVAVKKGETWWNTTADKKYEWVGEDNANCVWAPGTAPTMWTEIVE